MPFGLGMLILEEVYSHPSDQARCSKCRLRLANWLTTAKRVEALGVRRDKLVVHRLDQEASESSAISPTNSNNASTASFAAGCLPM